MLDHAITLLRMIVHKTQLVLGYAATYPIFMDSRSIAPLYSLHTVPR